MTIKKLRQSLKSIKEVIGYNNFPSGMDNLLIQAFIRRSYSQEHSEWQDNQVLEYIGDSFLDSYFVRITCSPKTNNYGSFDERNQFVSTKTEGALTKLKADYVNGKALAEHIDHLNLAQFLILGGADEKNNVRNKQSAKEDLFEAIVGAVALASDFDKTVVGNVCKKMLELDLQGKKQTKPKKAVEMLNLVGKPNLNQSKSQLYKLFQKKFINEPTYIDEELHSNDGKPLWKCTCKVNGYGARVNTDPQRNKRNAAKIAALGMLEVILGQK